MFEHNLAGQASHAGIRGYIGPLLAPGYDWNMEEAARILTEELVTLLPGDPWKGES